MPTKAKTISTPRLSLLEKQNKALQLTLANSILERRVQALAGRYDVVETNRNRRQPVVETENEDSTLNPRKRLLSHNIGRDLERNFSPARGMIHQFRINVVGSEGKIQVNHPGGDIAAEWFNQVWSKDCDYRDDVHWSTQLQNIVASERREGDLLIVFDDGITAEDTGKLLIWESDQIANLVDVEFKKLPGWVDSWTQDSGIVRDKMGKILGYICTGKRGLTVIDKIENATFFPREVARLVKNPWRVNQGRGISSALTMAANVQDLYEILSKELMSAKRAAEQYAFVKRSDAVVDFDLPAGSLEGLPENTGKNEADVATESAGGGASTERNYERLEAHVGGHIDYIDGSDEVTIPDINRPNVHLKDFTEFVMGMAGSSVGLARAYTLLRADSSYTAFRGDMVLTWATFRVMQKWLERMVADWVGVRAIRWGIRTGAIAGLSAGWESKLSFSWPVMPNVDELKEENAIKQALKNGTTDFSKLLGPDWRKKLESYAEQIAFVREKLLPLGILETIGGTAPEEKPDNEENNGDSQ